MQESRPPFPPFNKESATKKVRAAENGWNMKNPEKVSLAYTPDSKWRNRNQFIEGRKQIVEFLQQKWSCELDYRLIKELWAYTDNRIAVRFAYEWHDESNNWYRSYGNENWEFSPSGLMQRRIASINDLAIDKSNRKFLWESETRPEDYASLTELGL